jgi:hypothetical protein
MEASAMSSSLFTTLAGQTKRTEANVLLARYPASDLPLSDENVDLKYVIYLSE